MSDTRPASISALIAIGSGYRALKDNLKACLIIAVFTMFLPQLVCEFFFSLQANTIVENLINLGASMKTGASFRTLLDESSGFFYLYIALLIFVWFIFVSGYFALLEIFSLRSDPNSQEHEPQHQIIYRAINRGIKLSLGKGLFFSLLFLILSTVGQSIFPFLIFAAVLALMGPVLISFDGLGAFRAFVQSIFIKYPPEKSKISRWSIFFALSGLAAFFYTALFIVLYLNQIVAEFDQLVPLSRNIWMSKLPGLPFSVVYGFSEILFSALITILIVFLPASTAQLYFQINEADRPIEDAEDFSNTEDTTT